MYKDGYPETGGGARRAVTFVGLVAAIVLGVVVSRRLSSDAIALLIGVAAGGGASIPTALLLMAVTRRREEEPDRDYRDYRDDRRQAAPPVIVVAPGSVPQMMSQYPGAYQQLPPVSSRRQFRVMGYDEDEGDLVESDQRSTPWYE